MARQFPGKLLRQRGEVDGQGAQSVEAEDGIGCAGGTDVHPGDPAPDILTGLARQITVQLGKAAGKGRSVVPSFDWLDNERNRDPVNATRRAGRVLQGPRGGGRCGGGGSESASKNRIASSRASATVS